MLGPKSLRDEILGKISLDNIMNDTKQLAEGYPWRLAGTKVAADAAAFVADTMKKNGVDAKLLEVTGYLNIPEPAKLNMVSPDSQEMECAACAQIGSTPKGGVTAELVYVASGGEENYIGKDVRGKIVLAELSYAPPRPEKTNIAIKKGAAGMLIMNWGTDENPLMTYGTVKPVWGNPTPETIHLMDNTPPVLSITRPDGIRLKKMLEKGEKVVMHMETNAPRSWMKFYLPYAEVKAEKGDGDFMLIGAHMDSWAQGASDNASGNATKIELARVLQQNRHLLKRDVRFVFWQGHENGIMEGSSWFVDKFWDELDENCVSYFTYDTFGLQGATVWHNDSSTELFAWHREVEDEIFPNKKKTRVRDRRTGDQSLFGVGIPSMNCWMMHTPEEIKKWNNATLGEWYHSEADTMQYIDRGVMDESAQIAGAFAFEMATARVLPMNFVHVADEIIVRINELQALISKRDDAKMLLDLDDVIKYSLLFKSKVQSIEAFRKIIEGDASFKEATINNALKKLSRTLMPALCTLTGRYEQDTYGLSALGYVFPGSESIQKLVGFPSGSHEYYLWSTRARRERNRITDALRHAIEICDSIIG